jgi:hypothetical protein
VKSTAIVNHYYIYAVDRDFGPFFLKFCTYFPFNAKLCLNGHEYAKRNRRAKASSSRRSTTVSSAAPSLSACKLDTSGPGVSTQAGLERFLSPANVKPL